MDKGGDPRFFLFEAGRANTILFFDTFSNVANSKLVPQWQPSPLAYTS